MYEVGIAATPNLILLNRFPERGLYALMAKLMCSTIWQGVRSVRGIVVRKLLSTPMSTIWHCGKYSLTGDALRDTSPS